MKESNVRNLTKTLAVLSLLAPASAHPLGIGGIKLHSALNQNLNAEISLVLSQGETVSDIKVHLAPPDKYDEAGVPWNSFLSKIKFEPVVRPDGTVVIRLSSREALKEPFLGLLLEVSWPKGSLYREFSVLVDPPEVYQQPTIPVVRLPEQLKAESPAPMAPRAESPMGQVRPMQRAARSKAAVSDKYGPTSRRDTLWKISEPASRQRNVSVEQMMIALYEENPGAFFKENINALRAGKTLKIPERSSIVKISRKQALAEYQRHSEAWKNRANAVAVETPAPVTKEKPASENQVADNQLDLEAPSEATVLDNAVITPGQEQGTIGAKSQAADKSAGAARSGAGGAGNTDDLQRQMLEMQNQLAKLQEMIALKDQQLAALQQQAESQQALAASEQKQAQTAAQPSGQSPAQSPSQPSVQPADQSGGVNAPAVQQAEAQQNREDKAAPPVDAGAPKTAVKSAVKPKKPIQQPEMESGPELPFYMTMGSVGLGLLSVVGWLWWRKRKTDAKTDSESMFAPTIITKPVHETVQDHTAHAAPQLSDDSGIYNVEPVGESSFLSEFTPSDFDAFDTDQGEIDPVSEADVYLAYGRYQQAEELMRQAIVDQPDRDECKLKLFEIFYANENRNAFEAYANELAAKGKQRDKGFWAKVVEMGNEICPDSPLFGARDAFTADEVQEGNSPVNLAKEPDDAFLDFDSSALMEFDDVSLEPLMDDAALAGSANSESSDFDFDLSLFGKETKNGGDDEPRNNETLDFDLDSLLAFQEDSVPRHANGTPEDMLSKSGEPENRDFDLEFFDFNLDKGSSVGNEPESIADIKASGDQETGLETFSLDGDFNFDFDLSGDDDEQLLDQLAVSDLTDMDEYETKLDLAKAYMDMGDEASAKEIVEQVLEKGSDDQKKVAQRIIDHLA